MYEIKHRLTEVVLYRSETADSLRAAVIEAVAAGANLAGANLAGVNLADVYLADANLADANLTYANLTGANLTGANLTGASLADADLADANLTGANLTGTDILDDLRIPRVPSLHRRMLAAIEADPKSFDMGNWHSCDTTHCRAGWAIHLAGAAGYALEMGMSAPTAGALIHLVSCPQLKGIVPDFFAANEDALADIRRLAAMEPELVDAE